MLNLDKIKTNTAFFGYVYKIRFTHPETKEIYYYIGKKESSFVDETYWGSSLILNNLIKKYSVSCVSREIIATAHTREELSFLELLIIKQHSENYKTCLLNIKGNSNYTNNSLINESILRIKSKKPFNQDEIFSEEISNLILKDPILFVKVLNSVWARLDLDLEESEALGDKLLNNFDTFSKAKAAPAIKAKMAKRSNMVSTLTVSIIKSNASLVL